MATQPTDPYKRVTRCKPWSSYCPQRRWAPHTTGTNNVFFVILNDQQHSVHFCEEEAFNAAAYLDFEYNAPEVNFGVQGNHNIKVLSFTEMMESSVEMVI